MWIKVDMGRGIIFRPIPARREVGRGHSVRLAARRGRAGGGWGGLSHEQVNVFAVSESAVSSLPGHFSEHVGLDESLDQSVSSGECNGE